MPRRIDQLRLKEGDFSNQWRNDGLGVLAERSWKGTDRLRPAGRVQRFESGHPKDTPRETPHAGPGLSRGKDGSGHCAVRPMSDAPTVFIIDDDEPVRATLSTHVRRAELACETYAGAEAFLAEVEHRGPGCVVTDVMLPGMTGMGLLEALQERDWGWPVILLTGHADVDLAVSAFRSGAFDFLVKPVTGFKLVEVVQRAIADSTEQFRARVQAQELERKLGELTPRERDILPLLVTGATAKEIARSLSISHRTVEHYRYRVLDKFGVRTVLELSELLKG